MLIYKKPNLGNSNADLARNSVLNSVRDLKTSDNNQWSDFVQGGIGLNIHFCFFVFFLAPKGVIFKDYPSKDRKCETSNILIC